MECPNQLCGCALELADLAVAQATSKNFPDLVVHQQCLINTNLNQWHDRLASRLPVEIMSRIFMFFDNVNIVGEDDMYVADHANWDHFLRAPMLLSRVCRKWRHVVLGTPQLWTNYYFNVFAMSYKLNLLKEFISHSGSLPLSFVMWGLLSDSDSDERKNISMDLLATLIRSYSNRWKFLDIGLVPDVLTCKLFQSIDYIPLPILEGLQIDYSSLSGPIRVREPIRWRRQTGTRRGWWWKR